MSIDEMSPMTPRNMLFLVTASGRTVHNAVPAYGARLMHAAGETMTAVCGVRGEPVVGTSLPRCKRCFKESA